MKTVDLIQSFIQLKKGWDGADADPPSHGVIAKAKRFAQRVDQKRLPFYFAAPGPNGEISIEYKQDSKEASVFFYEDHEPVVVLSEGQHVLVEGALEKQFTAMLKFLNT